MKILPIIIALALLGYCIYSTVMFVKTLRRRKKQKASSDENNKEEV